MVAFDFYKDTYAGSSISEGEWPLYEKRAAEKLAYYRRIYTVTAPEANAEAMAICAMADALAYFTAAMNGAGVGVVTAASIGSVSVTYGGSYGSAASSLDLSAKGQEKELLRCAKLYLDVYRGVGGC